MKREGTALAEREYFYEDYSDGAGIRYAVDEVMYRGRTAFQEVFIFRNSLFGKILVLDGVVQTTTSDEFIYHEMLAHTPIFAHGAVRKVLIVGGGDGGMLRQVLKHQRIDVSMIDIDPELIGICKEFLPELSQGAFDHERATLFEGDGFEFVRQSKCKFDVIIVDSTDPLGGPGDILFSREFYQACANCLTPAGILTMQSGVPHHEAERITTLKATLGQVFQDMKIYLAPIPSYFGGHMAFGWGSNSPTLQQQSEDVLRRRFEAADISTTYYTPSIHNAAFSLPKYIQDMLA